MSFTRLLPRESTGILIANSEAVDALGKKLEPVLTAFNAVAKKSDSAPSTSEQFSAKAKWDAVDSQTAATTTALMDKKVQAAIDGRSRERMSICTLMGERSMHEPSRPVCRQTLIGLRNQLSEHTKNSWKRSRHVFRLYRVFAILEVKGTLQQVLHRQVVVRELTLVLRRLQQQLLKQLRRYPRLYDMTCRVRVYVP